jgi:flagellar hook-associated protein 1 FlgK
MVATAGGAPQPMQPQSGALAGLLQLRNTEIPRIQAQFSQYVTQAVNAINQAHNAATAVPPPAQLTGRNTGLDLPTAVSGFTGKTTVAVTDTSGTLQSRIDIDFDAGTMTVDGGGPVSFTPSTFLSTLNTALGANGSASFSNGALSLQAAAGDGLSISDDPTTPSSKAGRGFSQFFGLNDLIVSSGFPNTATGLSGTDPNGFNAGGVLTLQLRNASGAALRNATVTVPAGGTVNDLVTALNDPATGVGLYGSYSLSSSGQLTFTPNQTGVNVGVLTDTTQRGAGGPSVSALFGLDTRRTYQLPQTFAVRPDIAANGMNLAMAQFDQTAVAGQTALSPGDARGGLALAAVGNQNVSFNPAGSFGAMSTTLADYASQLSGSIAQTAANAETNTTNAQAVAAEAQSRRDSVEGVNMDQELVNLTTYQQAYAASARLLQTVSQMYQILLNIQ